MQWDQSSAYWYKAEYSGPIIAYDPGSCVIPVSIKSTKSALDQKGATAIARVKPTNAIADVATTLAEFYRDGLPKAVGSSFWKDPVKRGYLLSRDKSELGKKASDDFLNTEFGWAPLVSDVGDIVTSIISADSILDALERGSKQAVRRRYAFPDEVTASSPVSVGSPDMIITSDDPVFRTGNVHGPATTYRQFESARKVWFSGAFTYHLPSGVKSRNARRKQATKARALLGVNLTPELLWNVAPWSWAVDWFSNAGDVISNLSDWATDGLVLKYGYVMEHSSASNTYFQVDGGRLSLPGVIASPLTARIETKQRVEATPFGFGLNWEAFTPRQWAIVTALGLSRK